MSFTKEVFGINKGKIMNHLKKALAVSILVLSSSSASAGDVSIAYGMNTIDLGGVVEIEPSTIVLSYNHDLGNNFSIDGKLGIGAGSDSIGGFDLSIQSIVGGYGKYTLPLHNTSVELFAQAGIASLSLEADDDDSESESGLSYGFGASAQLNDKGTRVFAEYMVYPQFNEDDFDIDTTAINLGVTFGF